MCEWARLHLWIVRSPYQPALDPLVSWDGPHEPTLQELGEAVAAQRRKLGLKQGVVALQAGVTQESLSRFERGRATEFGSRKLLALLAVLGLEVQFTPAGVSGSLEELRRERGASP